MTTLTIQAMDTASAMDKIAEQLGEDALILSTTKKDGKVFMQASNGAGLPSPVTNPKDFSTMFAFIKFSSFLSLPTAVG